MRIFDELHTPDLRYNKRNIKNVRVCYFFDNVDLEVEQTFRFNGIYIYDLDCRLVVESTFRFLMTHQSIMAVEPTKPERQFMYGWHLQRRNVYSHRKLAHYSISSFFLWKPFGCPSQSAHTGNTIETSRCATKWRSDTRYNSSDYKFQYYFPLKKKKNLNAR